VRSAYSWNRFAAVVRQTVDQVIGDWQQHDASARDMAAISDAGRSDTRRRCRPDAPVGPPKSPCHY
jgi:hypothetical protein